MTLTFRHLATSEAGFVGPAPTTCAFEVTLRGRLDLDALTRAFHALRAEHPALDAAVTTGAPAARPAFGTGSGAPLTIGTGPALADPEQALGRLHVDSDGDRHRITLAASHALTDGTHLFALLSRLFSHYTALRSGTFRYPAAPAPFPFSAQDVLPGLEVPAIDTGRDRLDGTRWYGFAPTGPADGVVAPQTRSLRFSPEATARFADSARGIGINALLTGILLGAERAGFVDDAPGTPIRIGAMTLVDLRRRVRPVLAATTVTNFVGASFAAVELTADSDPAATGSAVVDQLRTDLHAGRCLAVLAEQAPTPSVQPPTVLSNLGALTLDLPADLDAEDLRPVVWMDSAALHGPAGRPSPSASIFQVSTFAGRLGIDVITLGGTASQTARDAVANRIETLVLSAAHLAPAV
ncbi:hypothetical protein GCM10027289_09920 [Tsukamurella serpentis]